MENDWWLVGVLEQYLLQDVEDNGDKEKGGESEADNGRVRRLRGEFAQWAGYFSEDAHSECSDERGTASDVGWIASSRGASMFIIIL